MKKLFAALALALLAGCSGQKYIEGTHLAIGAYVPGTGSGELYGIEICQYLSGCMVRTSSNQTFTVDREYSATNSYFFGMIEIREKTKTSVSTRTK